MNIKRSGFYPAAQFDDPGQHQLLEHCVGATGAVQTHRPITGRQRLPQMLGAGATDRQGPPPGLTAAEVQLVLPLSHPLLRHDLEDLDILRGVGRADMVHPLRPEPVGPHHLNGGRAAGCLDRPHVRRHTHRLEPAPLSAHPDQQTP